MIKAIEDKHEKSKAVRITRVACQTDLLVFCRYMSKAINNQKYRVAEHHKKIANIIEKVIKGELTRVIIHVAPRYGKTQLAVKYFIAHALALNPSAKFIHLSYSASLALDNSEEIRDIVRSDAYQELFPEVQIKKDSNSKEKWYTNQNGGVYATSSSGQITGFGAGKVEDEKDENLEEFMTDLESRQGFAGCIVIDDSMKPDEASSDVLREKVNQKFDTTIRNRVNSRKTPIIIIQQKLHEHDLSGYLQEIEPGVWTVLTLPAIYTEIVDGVEVFKALDPHIHTLEELRALEKLNPRVFDTQYMQNPNTKEGILFPLADMRFYDPESFDIEKLCEFKMAAIDPASGGDFFALIVGYLVGSDIYVHNVIFNTNGERQNSAACIAMISNNKVNKTAIETNTGTMLASVIKEGVNAISPESEVRSIRNTTNKHVRILDQEGFIKMHMVFRSNYKKIPEYEAYMKNLTTYNKDQTGSNKNKNDDAPDVTSELMKLYRKTFPHLY